VAAFQAPDATACAYVDIVDALGSQLLGAANVVDIVRVAAIDQDVALFKHGSDLSDGFFHGAGRNHEPKRTRLDQLADHVFERRSSSDAWCFRQLAHCFGRTVKDHALLTM